MKELAILAGNNKIMINGIEIKTKEYKGQRVITSYDVAKLHNREPNEVTKNFNRNNYIRMHYKIYIFIGNRYF